MTKIKTFRDLEVWKKAFNLAVEIIRLAEKPTKGMTTRIILEQLLRASTSISANIAEGYGSFFQKRIRQVFKNSAEIFV